MRETPSSHAKRDATRVAAVAVGCIDSVTIVGASHYSPAWRRPYVANSADPDDYTFALYPYALKCHPRALYAFLVRKSEYVDERKRERERKWKWKTKMRKRETRIPEDAHIATCDFELLSTCAAYVTGLGDKDLRRVRNAEKLFAPPILPGRILLFSRRARKT